MMTNVFEYPGSFQTTSIPQPQQSKNDYMQVFYSPIGSGKTTELIKLASENGGYIVCANTHRRQQIFAQAKSLGLPINFPLTFDDFLENRFCARNIKSFLIDEVESLLLKLAKGPRISAITITDEKSNLPPKES